MQMQRDIKKIDYSGIYTAVIPENHIISANILDNNRLWRITADYRPESQHNSRYYVLAENKNAAKRLFLSRISWLKIYDCSEVDDKKEASKIISQPYKYIVIS